jgi:hypothetical protein
MPIERFQLATAHLVGLIATVFGYETSMTDTNTDPHTEDAGTGPEGANSDVQSDPAEGESSGDWSGEGGATQDGPATDTD